jgi:hypothetical protein
VKPEGKVVEMGFQFAKIFSTTRQFIPTLILEALRSAPKDQRRGNSNQGWILAVAFLLCLGCVTGCASLSPSAPISQKIVEESAPVATSILSDVQVVDKSDSLVIILVGSDDMVYSVFRSIDPLELVVDLPDTVAETEPPTLNVDNQLVGKIEILKLTTESRSMIRVKIGLNRETPYRVIQAYNQLRVHLEKTSLPSASQQTQVEPIVESKAEILRPGTRMDQELDASRSAAKKSMSSSGAAEKEPFGSASKILDLDSVTMNQELRFYILADGGLANFKVFHLTDPPRVVVDLMDIQSIETPDVWRLNGPLVSKVRISLKENKVRLVFRLVPEAGLPYKVSTGNNTLQISFTPGPGFTSH